jgi:putative tricarboxylic transport membrane protein
MKVSDRLTGLLLMILGSLTYWGGSKLPPVPGQQVGPDVFPMVIGAALVVCGLLIALGVGRTFEENEKIVVSDDGAVVDADAPKQSRVAIFFSGGWKVLVPPLALFFYYFASEKLGFWLTATLMIFVLARSQGAKLKGSVLLALLAPVFVHLVFYKLLRVPLPVGILSFPWA